MEQRTYVADDDWATVVRNVPIVSVDLVVLAPLSPSSAPTDERPNDAGDIPTETDADVADEWGVVLAKRENEPARGEWFVPGGRVGKGERLTDAVQRVAREELGTEVTVERELGVYEHLYDTADVDDAGGKHYVPTGYVVRAPAASFELDDQHSAVRVFSSAELPDDLHPYTAAYLADAGFI
jgi:colanic acid biosynthesis protein WcaH